MEIAAILPHPRNPRKHPKIGSPLWEVMRRSLENDYFDPIVVNLRNRMVVSGHLRLKLLQEMGYSHVDVSVVDYDEETHFARMIAANRLLGEFEELILASLAKDIEAAGLDAALAGYDHKALMALLDGPDIKDDTDEVIDLVTAADKLQEKWQVQPGDLFNIGPHRVLCGDGTKLDNWQRLLRGGTADMMWTDPPYNVAYDASRNNAAAPARTIKNDDLPPDKYNALLAGAFRAGFEMVKQGGAFYVSHADSYGLDVRIQLREARWEIKQCLIWVKDHWTMSRQDYEWQHEPILYGWKPGAAHYWQGGFCHSTVIDDEASLAGLSKKDLVEEIQRLRNARDTSIIREPKPVRSELHPTIKPVRLVARSIWNSSRRGELVMDPFLGSGTTMIASEQTARRCVATEDDPKFVAVVLERAGAHGLSIEKENPVA